MTVTILYRAPDDGLITNRTKSDDVACLYLVDVKRIEEYKEHRGGIAIIHEYGVDKLAYEQLVDIKVSK